MREAGTRPARIPHDGAIWATIRSLDPYFESVAIAFGFIVMRESGAYVSYQGDGVLRVAPYAELDHDDTLGQMVIHELCHFFVEGATSRNEWDWGLANDRPDDEPSELAAIRAQAALLASFGLRKIFAPTTVYRFDYDRLPVDPLAGDSGEAERARNGLARFRSHEAYAQLEATLRQAQELSRA
jgi:hypothetical protein